MAGALAMPAVLVGGWVAADAVQRPRYSAVRQTISVAAGHAAHDRWVMTGALLVVGVLYLLVAGGLRPVPRRARVGLVVAGGAAIGIALCPQPAVGSSSAHQAFTALGEVTLAIWPLLMCARRSRARLAVGARTSVSGGLLCLGLLAWLMACVVTGSADLGLVERLATAVQVTWPAVVIVGLSRSLRRECTKRDDVLARAGAADGWSRSRC